MFTDADRNETGAADRLTATFAMWPVDDPSARDERELDTHSPSATFIDYRDDQFQHGKTYAWQVRSTDGVATTPWSRTCYFTRDFERPDATPTLVSVEWPEEFPDGGVGVPGRFTFGPNGVDDIGGYAYGFGHSANSVAAGADGRATVTITPTSGFSVLSVASLDKGGNRSDTVTFDVFVPDTRPIVEGVLESIGVATPFTFRSPTAGVVSYRYALDGDEEQTVAAGADGEARVEITARTGGWRELTVTSRTASGFESTTVASYYLLTEPLIASTVYPESGPGGGPGVEGLFTLTPRMPGVTGYAYAFDGQAEETVDAAADGSATVRFTPSTAGSHYLTARSIGAGGVESDPATYYFTVIDPLPHVFGNPYSPSGPGGGPGIEGQFGFTSELPDVTAFVYRFGDEPEQTVEAPSGYANVTWTPQTGGPHTLVVRSRTADGTLSAPRTYEFQVFSGPVVESADYPSDRPGALLGTEGTFTFRPALADVVSYRYAFNYDEQQTVAAAADGTASVRWTSTITGANWVRVSAVTADGTVSDERYYQFEVTDPRPVVESDDYDRWVVSGGVGVPGEFRFSSPVPDVARFEYWLNDGAHHTADADADGNATIDLAPDQGFDNVLRVRSHTDGGAVSEVTEYAFVVSTRPTISSQTYPNGVPGGGVGVPGVFELQAGMPGVVELVYVIDGQPQTVAVDAQGHASFTFTPTDVAHFLAVYSLTAEGTLSHIAEWSIIAAT